MEVLWVGHARACVPAPAAPSQQCTGRAAHRRIAKSSHNTLVHMRFAVSPHFLTSLPPPNSARAAAGGRRAGARREELCVGPGVDNCLCVCERIFFRCDVCLVRGSVRSDGGEETGAGARKKREEDSKKIQDTPQPRRKPSLSLCSPFAGAPFFCLFLAYLRGAAGVRRVRVAVSMVLCVL